MIYLRSMKHCLRLSNNCWVHNICRNFSKHNHQYIDDIISAFEEDLGYRPNFEYKNIMNVIQTMTLIDE